MVYSVRLFRSSIFWIAALLGMVYGGSAFAQCPSGYTDSIDLTYGTIYSYPAVTNMPSPGETVWPYCVEAAEGETVTVSSFTVPECMAVTESGTWSATSTWPTRTPGGGDPVLGSLENNTISGVHFTEDIPEEATGQFYVAVNGTYIDAPVPAAVGTDAGLASSLVSGPDPICRQLITLPVEWLDFNGTVEASRVTLTWETATEKNNAGFGVQHALSGGGFDEVGFVDGAGTTLDSKRYSYSVNNLAPGTHTFRLQQIDFDGSTSYSPEIEVVVELASRFHLSDAYPNPFNPATTLTLTVSTSQNVRVTMHDAGGRVVRHVMQSAAAPNTPLPIRVDATGLPSGWYVVRAAGEIFIADAPVMLLK